MKEYLGSNHVSPNVHMPICVVCTTDVWFHRLKYGQAVNIVT